MNPSASAEASQSLEVVETRPTQSSSLFAAHATVEHQLSSGLELVGPTTLKSPDKPDDNYSDNLKISLKLPDSYLIARMITLK